MKAARASSTAHRGLSPSPGACSGEGRAHQSRADRFRDRRALKCFAAVVACSTRAEARDRAAAGRAPMMRDSFLPVPASERRTARCAPHKLVGELRGNVCRMQAQDNGRACKARRRRGFGLQKRVTRAVRAHRCRCACARPGRAFDLVRGSRRHLRDALNEHLRPIRSRYRSVVAAADFKSRSRNGRHRIPIL